MKFDISFLREVLSDCIVVVDGEYKYSIAECPVSKVEKLSCFNNDCDVAIDSRTISSGQIFLAHQGNKFDSHEFLSVVLEKGASALIIDESKVSKLQFLDQSQLKNVLVILVSDPLKVLILLAKAWRKRFSYPVVGITGSIGKTSTKEMLSTIFKTAGIFACTSYKNQNTLIGLCLNILRMRQEHKVAVFELGIDKKGEMAELADVLRPTIGLITTVSHVHVQGLGSLPAIVREKCNIFKYFKQENVGIVYGDKPLLNKVYFDHPIIRFGFKMKNQIQARMVQICQNSDNTCGTHFLLKVYKKRSTVILKTNHRGAVQNALAASAVAHLLEIPFDMIVNGLGVFNGFERRFESKKLQSNGGVLINDCYNANPESMKAAIIAFHEMNTNGAKIAVLGDMLELGEKEAFWHRQVGRVLGKALSLDYIILVGKLARIIAKTAPLTMKIKYAADWKDAEQKLNEILNSNNSLVLVKGSRAMGLDNLVKAVTE